METNIPLRFLYAGILIVLSYTDIRWRRIPNRIVYPSILIGFAAALLAQNVPNALLGGLVGTLTLVTPVLFYGSERAGMGDVKLALFMGLILGVPSILYALGIASIVAGIFALFGLLLRRVSRETQFPFAPFLAFGTIVLLLK